MFVGAVDNFTKPWLIGFSVEMPMSLTILGVFGGFLAFGFLVCSSADPDRRHVHLAARPGRVNADWDIVRFGMGLVVHVTTPFGVWRNTLRYSALRLVPDGTL